MKTRISAILACAFVLILTQLLSLLVGPLVGVAGGAIVSVLALLLTRFFEIQAWRKWVAIALPGAASLLGVLPVFAAERGTLPPYVWLAPAVAVGCSLLAFFIGSARAKRCSLCNRRLGGSVAFDCPRCGLLVCDSCWVFESRRCRLCEQNHVPIFSPDGRWWDRELGPRTNYGRCQLCQRPASEADLRACRKCGRPQCRDCWDSANGECSRCRWTIENVPDSLKPYILSSREPKREVRAARRQE